MCFYLIYMIFASLCFDHDAFMHHTVHVLDTPLNKVPKSQKNKSQNRSSWTFLALKKWQQKPIYIKFIQCPIMHS